MKKRDFLVNRIMVFAIFALAISMCSISVIGAEEFAKTAVESVVDPEIP